MTGRSYNLDQVFILPVDVELTQLCVGDFEFVLCLVRSVVNF